MPVNLSSLGLLILPQFTEREMQMPGGFHDLSTATQEVCGRVRNNSESLDSFSSLTTELFFQLLQ